MPVAQFLVDVSAWARYPCPEIAKRLDELSEAGVLGTCSLIELELLSVIPDRNTYTRVVTLRQAAVPTLEMGEGDIRRALEVQRALMERDEVTIPWLTLVVSAVAERHSVVFLHRNRCFDVIAGVTGQAAEWVA